MILQNYEKIQPSVFNRLEMPHLTEPFDIRVHWFHAVEQKMSDYVINRRMHHHQFYEAHFIINGQTSYADESGESFALSEGEGILIAPHIQHVLKEIGEGAIKFSIAFTVQDDSELHRALGNRMLSFPLPHALTDAIDTVLLQIAEPTAFSSAILRGRLLEIVSCLSSICHTTQGALPPALHKDHRVAMAKAYIRDNDHLFLSCKDVATHCNLSVKHLDRLFASESQMPLLQYIHEAKLDAARDLLSTTALTLQEISERLGFSSVYYFHRFFKRQTGVTPVDYRKQR